VTPASLLEIFRSDVQDQEEPYLWDNTEIYRYMDAAQIEFARLSDYFIDSTTFGSIQVAVTGAMTGDPNLTFANTSPATITRDAGSWLTDGFVANMGTTVSSSVSNNGTYSVAIVTATILTLSATDSLVAEGPTNGHVVTGVLANPGILTITNANRILRIRRAKLALQSRPLTLKTVDQVDRNGILGDDYGLRNAFNWETSVGSPYVLITDWDRNTVRLVPHPSSNDTLALSVYRKPLTTIVQGATSFEVIEEEHHRTLALWMKHLAYLKQDADTFDDKLSNTFATEFFSEVSKVRRDSRRQHLVAGTTKYGGL